MAECAKCKQVIRLKKTTHEGKDYHAGCFSCNICKKSLENVKCFIVSGEEFFHSLCFEQHQGYICEKCKELIDGECYMHTGKQYHGKCFLCDTCGKSMADSEVVTVEGKLHHAGCYKEFELSNCCACLNVIEMGYEFVEYNGMLAHHKCFVCFACKKKLFVKDKFRINKATTKVHFYCIGCSGGPQKQPVRSRPSPFKYL